MSNILTGLTYSYNRNIGWQDRIIRTVFGILAAGGALYFRSSHLAIAAILGGVFLAQVITVFSTRCMICYFLGMCTITSQEKKHYTHAEYPLKSTNLRASTKSKSIK